MPKVAPGKPALEPRDFPTAYPFRAVLDGALTTHVVNEWKVVEELLATAEASTSAGKQAVNDEGKAVQVATAEDVDVCTA
jgi:hypothetical protein